MSDDGVMNAQEYAERCKKIDWRDEHEAAAYNAILAERDRVRALMQQQHIVAPLATIGGISGMANTIKASTTVVDAGETIPLTRTWTVALGSGFVDVREAPDGTSIELVTRGLPNTNSASATILRIAPERIELLSKVLADVADAVKVRGSMKAMR